MTFPLGDNSLSIDNSIVTKKDICGLKVRYRKDHEGFVTEVNGLKTAINKSKIEKFL